METKHSPTWTKAADDRTVVGIVAVHGNVDSGSDRSHPGSFANVKVDGRDRARFLWNHNSAEPPIAKIDSVREVSRAELPPAVLAYAPDATGGVEIARTYLDTPKANEVLAGIKAGVIDEMSYAYDLTEYKFTTDGDRQVREIYGVRIYDYSDVTWGMNPATLAKKSALAAAPFADHFSMVLAAIEDLAERTADLKRLRETDGRHLSTINIDRVKTLCDQLAPLQADLRALLSRPEPTASPDAALRAEFYQLKARAYDLGVI